MTDLVRAILLCLGHGIDRQVWILVEVLPDILTVLSHDANAFLRAALDILELHALSR